MACPFFMPVEKLQSGSWLHPSRLPLGCGWSGHCTAPGHENEIPSEDELHNFCNLGYADGCGRLPQNRSWDTVRFALRTISDGENKDARRVRMRYICERNHLPAASGVLEFNLTTCMWTDHHPDVRVQRMAECFLRSYTENRKHPEAGQTG